LGNTADPYFNDVISRWRLCRFCLHLHNLMGKLTCNAFPEVIPPEIASGGVIHNKPFPGQESDLTFDPCGAGPKEFRKSGVDILGYLVGQPASGGRGRL
jgi:hypothetical protein